MKRLQRFVNACREIDNLIAGLETALIVGCIVILVVAEVAAACLRELSRINFAWIEEILKYLVIWIGLLGASLATRTREHISIEAISRFSGRKMRRAIAVFTNLATTIVTLLLAIAAYNYLLDDWREYQISGGYSRYVSLDGIEIYYCPHTTNQKREKLARVRMQTKGYSALLTQALNDEKTVPARIDYLGARLDSHLAQQKQLAEWKQDWLRQQWQQHWRQQWQQAWQQKGKALWRRQGSKAVSVSARSDWQARWLAQLWRQTGRSEYERAWESDGKKAWARQKDSSDLDAEEFREEWKYNWLKKKWAEQWQQQMESDWGKNGGARQCFQNAWKQKWLQQQWYTHWQQQWLRVRQAHHCGYLSGGACPICGQKLVPQPLRLPRWLLLLIIPIALLITALRFFVNFLETIAFPEIANAEVATDSPTGQETHGASRTGREITMKRIIGRAFVGGLFLLALLQLTDLFLWHPAAPVVSRQPDASGLSALVQVSSEKSAQKNGARNRVAQCPGPKPCRRHQRRRSSKALIKRRHTWASVACPIRTAFVCWHCCWR